LAVAVMLFVGGVLGQTYAGVAVGLESPKDYLTRTLGGLYEAESYVNENLSANARIVLFDEARGFYLDRDYMWGNPNHHDITPWTTFHTGSDMVNWYRKNGYTHMLLDNRTWMDLRKRNEKDVIHDMLFSDAISHGLMREVYHSDTGTYSVYEFGE